jgi:hypothetical protein
VDKKKAFVEIMSEVLPNFMSTLTYTLNDCYKQNKSERIHSWIYHKFNMRKDEENLRSSRGTLLFLYNRTARSTADLQSDQWKQDSKVA